MSQTMILSQPEITNKVNVKKAIELRASTLASLDLPF